MLVVSIRLGISQIGLLLLVHKIVSKTFIKFVAHAAIVRIES
jgi:hypothetical protein